MRLVTLLKGRLHSNFYVQKLKRKFFSKRKKNLGKNWTQNLLIFWNNYQNFLIESIIKFFWNNYQSFFFKSASRNRLVSRATMIWSALDFHDLRDCSKYPYRYNWINRKFFISLWSPIILWDLNTAPKYDSKFHFNQNFW